MADVHFQLQFYSYAVQYKMYTFFLDSPPPPKKSLYMFTIQ